MTPLILRDSTRAIMVCRGFIPFADRTPQSWEKYNRTAGEVTVDGVVKPSVPARMIGPRNPHVQSATQFERIWLFPEIEKIAMQFPYPLINNIFLQQIGSASPGEFPAETRVIDIPPSTHFGYTIEWIVLACVTLLIGFSLQAFPSRRRYRIDQHPEQVLIFAAAMLTTLLPLGAAAETASPTDVGIIERLGTQVDLQLSFTDESGNTRPLSSHIIPERPLVLLPVYYRCPRICSLTLRKLSALINELALTPGRDYTVAVLSFDPAETAQLAQQRHRSFTAQLSAARPEESSVSFLTGEPQNIDRLMNQVGFFYRRDGDDWSHVTALILLTPAGEISRYFYGIDFPPSAVRRALVEAAAGKIGSPVDRMLLYCFRYDPARGRYTPLIWNITRVVCISVALVLLLVLLGLFLKEKRTANDKIS